MTQLLWVTRMLAVRLLESLASRRRSSKVRWVTSFEQKYKTIKVTRTTLQYTKHRIRNSTVLNLIFILFQKLVFDLSGSVANKKWSSKVSKSQHVYNIFWSKKLTYKNYIRLVTKPLFFIYLASLKIQFYSTHCQEPPQKSSHLLPPPNNYSPSTGNPILNQYKLLSNHFRFPELPCKLSNHSVTCSTNPWLFRIYHNKRVHEHSTVRLTPFRIEFRERFAKQSARSFPLDHFLWFSE